MTENDGFLKPWRLEHAWKRRKDGCIVVRTKNYRLIALAPMGADILMRCDGKHSIPEIIDDIQAKYSDVPGNEIATEVKRFISYMESEGPVITCWDLL